MHDQHPLTLTFIFLWLAPSFVFPCTTILVGSGLTADGSVLHAHNEDMGIEAAGRLWRLPARTFPKGTLVSLPYLEIQQAASTYAYWASGNASGTAGPGLSDSYPDYNDILVGMNSQGLSLSCNWMHSREANSPEKGINRYALRQLILERAATAQEAVQLIGRFIEQYGQADWGGLTYCLADSKEAWVVETTTHHWVAHRVRDDEIRVIANRFTITDDYDLSSPHLMEDAVRHGWYEPYEGPFSFQAAYGKDGLMNQAYDTEREERALALLEPKKGLISPEDLMLVLRDRYEGTLLYRAPVAAEIWRAFCAENHLPRPISTGICQSSSVAHLRPDLPVEAGAVMWYALATPHASGYFPLYAGSAKVPAAFSKRDGTSTEGSAWWSFRTLQQKSDEQYVTIHPLSYNFWTAHHQQMARKQKMIETKIMAMLQKGEKEKASQLMNAFSYGAAAEVLYHAQRMAATMK